MNTPLRDVPYMGVIYVVAEASKLGYHGDHPDWCNLGQGMPEVGPLPGAPPRVDTVKIDWRDHAYGPVGGIPELREAVARQYNKLYRKGKKSQYSAANVAITAGGRLALTRAIWAIDKIKLGYFTPDYTAYEDLIGGIPRIQPVHIKLEAKNGFRVGALPKADAYLISNPCNPTGVVLRDPIWKGRKGAFLFDEFYSHYTWNGGPASMAAHVGDVDRDPVLLFDGLTKNYRYPGWRVGWTVGPREWIETITRSGSAIDGGAPRWLQRAAVPIVENDAETDAMRAAFRPKRDVMVEKLRKMGVEFANVPEGTFYCWGSVAKTRIKDGFAFFREALKHKVLTVPGEFFDVNPGKARKGKSYLKSFVRFSFGPPMEVVRRGLDRLEKMLC